MEAQKWLSLKQAAEQLAVHPTTLRRWADKGAIAVMVTPGGHRRFRPQDIRAFSTTQAHPSADAVGTQWVENALVHTRRELVSHPPHARWLQEHSAESRSTFRSLGQQTVGLVMQNLALDEADDGLLDQAVQLGQEYGRLGKASGMSLTELLQASLFFHEQLLESSLTNTQGTAVRPKTTLRILQRTNTLLNTLHLAIAAEYEPHT